MTKSTGLNKKFNLNFDFDSIKGTFDLLFSDLLKGISLSKDESEEKLKMEVEKRLFHFLRNHGIDVSNLVSYETYSIASSRIKGRTDAQHGNLIIEYKKVGLLSKTKELEKGVRQLQNDYLSALPEDQRASFSGILFDGETIVFIRWIEDSWRVDPKKFDENSLYDWILVLSGAAKKHVSPKTLKDDFLLSGELATNLTSMFYSKLNNALDNDNQRVKMLFDEWDKTFRYVYGGILDEARVIGDFQSIAEEVLKTNKKIKVDRFLFSIYTYYAFVVKLFASEIACIGLRIYPESPIRVLLQTKNLSSELRYIEEGHFFYDLAGIDNYIEGGFFSWYLDAWDDDVQEVVIKTLACINEYDPNSFFIDEKKSRDLLKNLYQNIVPRTVRHDLGEYYTPDWLIEMAVDDSNYTGEIDSKILDPGCGSGGFLIEFINRIKNNPKSISIAPDDMLQRICSNVVGFDVNPVAVLTARTNYLIAIAPYLNKKEFATITIPVYLADSIITPTTEGKGKVTNNSYIISTVEGVFTLPKSLVDRNMLPLVLRSFEMGIHTGYSHTELFLTKEMISIGLTDAEKEELEVFYEKLEKLHSENRDKIWAKLILNSFAPLMYNEFDFVVGNPPWIKWDFLSEDYKKKLGILYLDIYRLFSHKGMKAGLGFAHDDISIVFTYVAMDKYLKTGGTLTFVLKQTLFKSMAGEQFRRFAIERYDGSIPVKCEKVQDLLGLNPFGQGQETCIATLKKGAKTTYPVPYITWSKNVRKSFTEIDTLNSVKESSSSEFFDAYPDPATQSDTAKWLTIPQGKSLPKFTTSKSCYPARHGVVNDLNTVFIIEILEKLAGGILKVRNRGDFGRKKTKIYTTQIEEAMVYPLLKPKSIQKWGIADYHYIVIPQMKAGENNLSELKIGFPKTYGYLSKFREELLGRKSKWFKGGDKPFYSLFGIGDYTFENFKVVWCCMSYKPHFSVVSSVTDQYLSNKKFIPDNTIGYLSFDNEDEAHYACAILNATQVTEGFALRSSKSKWGISIDMVNSVPIKEYDSQNSKHLELSNLSKLAHSHYPELNDIDSIMNKIDYILQKHSILNEI